MGLQVLDCVSPVWQAAVPESLRTQPKRIPPEATGRKGLIARALSAARLTPHLGRWLCPPHVDVRILAYHRVWNLGREDEFPYDAELISATPREFAWQMQYVRRHFDPITFAHFLDALDGRRSMPARPVIVTFDDGFEDNFTQAFPVLRVTGVPATIFLATDSIGADGTYWFDRLANLVLSTEHEAVPVPWLETPLQIGTSPAKRRSALRSILSVLKRVPNALRLEALEHLESELAPSAEQSDDLSRAMTWEQARVMAEAGIEFGSHTCSHPILANLTDDELEHELVESRQTIERELGRPVEVLSYPVGGTTAFDDRVQKAAAAAGYRLGVAYLPGMNPLEVLDRFGLKRLRMERYITREHFAAMLELPRWFS
jgi:peptidoglycan/xylan/chitin deacetylase (PgdA/CDA1 family)